MAGPIYNEFGAIVGLAEDHFILGPQGGKIAYIRGSHVYSLQHVSLGRLVKLRGRVIWLRK